MPEKSWNSLSIGPADLDKIDESLDEIQFVEVRLDLDYSALNIEKAEKIIPSIRKRGIEVIAACRREKDRGGFKGSEDERLELLKNAVRHGATVIDLEAGTKAEFLLDYENQNCRKILSYHNFKTIPDNIENILNEMITKRAWLYKIVCGINSYKDNNKMLDLNRFFSSRGCISSCFGAGAKCHYSRAFLGSRDGKMNYYGLSGKVTAPGQFTTDDRKLYHLKSIDRETKCFGVIGNPIFHSLSPVIHNTLFDIFNINAVFLPFYVDEIKDFLEFAADNRIEGIAITYPWKHDHFYTHFADIDESAHRFTSGNTISVVNGKYIFADTDYEGFEHFFKKKINARKGRVSIIGTGNTSRKIAACLKNIGLEVTMISRKAVERRIAIDAAYEVEDFSSLRSRDYNILINTSPSDVYSKEDWKEILPSEISPDKIIIDVNYGECAGRFLNSEVFKKNIKYDGLEMLLSQAIIQFRIWTGITVDENSLRIVYNYLKMDERIKWHEGKKS